MIVNEPGDVAAEGLAHLHDGPVYVAGGNAATAARNSSPDRARVVLEAHEAIRELVRLRK
jgi:hypothetical protein